MRRLEHVAAAAAAAVAAIVATWPLLGRDRVEGDAMVHQYWMRSFTDPELFQDPLTRRLRASERYPDGYEALFRVAAQVLDPILFGELLGVALMATSGYLVFAIVREHEQWRPAAWIGGALFLALDGHRFNGGFPRGFVHVVVLLCVLLAIRSQHRRAAAVAVAGGLFYPPAALLAVGVLCLAALRTRRFAPAVLAAGLGAAVVLAQQLAGGGGFDVMSAAEARRYPEFGPHGTLRFFADSPWQYVSQNRSGFDLRTTGLLLLGAAATLAALRPGALRRLRPEVVAMPAAAVVLWAAAQVLLFRLYLPHRYTYPVIAFLAIAVAVLLRPVAERAWRSAPAPAALAAGLALLIAVAATPRGVPGQKCPRTQAMAFLASLPKDAVVAGDPVDMKCVVLTARRPVVISTQLAPSYERAYFLEGRRRMFATLDAYYGSDARGLQALQDRYGARYLWVRRDAVRREMRGGARWRGGRFPYGRHVRRLLAQGEPAVLRLPARCARWRRGAQAVYEIACLRT